jgi:hypothetical protein
MSRDWHKAYASLRGIAVALLLGFLLTSPPPASPVFACKLQTPEKNTQAGQEYAKAPPQSPNQELDPFSFTSFHLLSISSFNSADCSMTCQQLRGG